MTPTTGNSASYSWDSPTGELKCANTNGTTCSTSSPTSSTTLYSYDGTELRTSSTINSTTTNYTWGDIGSSPEVLADGTWDYLYVPGSNVPLEQVAGSGSSPGADLLLSDPNGSVRGIVQVTSGTHQDQLVNYTDYDAYGDPIAQPGGSVETGGLTSTHTSINSNYVGTTPFGFGGGYTDSTGLIYLIHRYYDPTTGQFLSVDPDISTTNQAYDYTGDDPVNATDPSGTCEFGVASCPPPDPAPPGMTLCGDGLNNYYCVPCGQSSYCPVAGQGPTPTPGSSPTPPPSPDAPSQASTTPDLSSPASEAVSNAELLGVSQHCTGGISGSFGGVSAGDVDQICLTVDGVKGTTWVNTITAFYYETLPFSMTGHLEIRGPGGFVVANGSNSRGGCAAVFAIGGGCTWDLIQSIYGNLPSGAYSAIFWWEIEPPAPVYFDWVSITADITGSGLPNPDVRQPTGTQV